MRAFNLITFAVAIFVSEKAVRAEDMEIIDHDAPVEITEEYLKDLPEPQMPPNPYGDISLEDIVRTGTLDGVNKPSTPEEQEALDAIINFHKYTEASKDIDLSFDGLMSELKMDDLNDLMAKMQEDMEAEFMVNQLAQLNLNVEDMPTLTDKQKANVYEAMERLESLGVDLLDESYFSA